jgi:phage tail-like protein
MAEELIFHLHITGAELDQELDIPVGTLTIGRQSGSGVVLKHSLVSRQHAQITCTAEGCQITDLGSANSTLLNGEKIRPKVPVPLNDQDVVQIGPYQIVFSQRVAEPVFEPPPLSPEEELSFTPMTAEGPPAPPETPPSPPTEPVRPAPPPVPPGLSAYHSRYLDYLPGVYHTDFMTRFLALFESILAPIEWNVDNFDLFLDPQTTPAGFLPWLSNWFHLTFDDTWNDVQRRTLLAESHRIYARRGTKWALFRLLEIYTGRGPEIIDQSDELEPFTFLVKVPVQENEVNPELIEQLIDAHKPAHTSYKLQYRKR